ncbi:MAG: aromatic ring-hydroxylating dioxygenase subunit alpha [Gammaproteobacteria bacterium]|nr:aromatic ring-hydroxylating dioxygenase subunit alpha [Gammaproteobacteria bacterium]
MTTAASLETLVDVLAEYLMLEDVECLSLPPEAYLSPELHRLELERIFYREWLCVGREEYVPNPGDYYSFDLLSEPLVIVRGEDGQIRVLSSVCRHRYMPVIEGAGNTKRFVCPYHSWTYATDGTLVAAPFMKGSKRFERDSCRLPEYRLESWCGFIFVNLDDEAPPLAHRMTTLDSHIANYRVGQQVEIMHYESEWVGNWKLSAENSMEYYHHVGLHKATVGEQMPARNAYLPPPPTDLSFTHERCGINEAFKTANHPFNPKGRLDSFTEEELNTGYLVYVFPAFTMAMRPNANNWLSFRPNGIESTKILGGYLVSPEVREEFPDLAEQRRELILRVNEEDSHATTELAKAMRSSKAARGPLSPFEGTIAQFYRYLARNIVRPN